MQRTMNVVYPGGKQVDALFRGFTIQTDQDRESGGEASAPEPFDLFLASIGTCAGVYVLNFCTERELSTDGLQLHITIRRNKELRLVDKITIKIELPDGFPDKYKRAIMKTAGLCSVKKHLMNPPEFDIFTS
jgi:putative redox protein